MKDYRRGAGEVYGLCSHAIIPAMCAWCWRGKPGEIIEYDAPRMWPSLWPRWLRRTRSAS